MDLQRRVLDELGRERGRGADRHDLVVAVDNQRRLIESLEARCDPVSENTLMQSWTPLRPHIIPCSQNQSRRPCETLAPGRSTLLADGEAAETVGPGECALDYSNVWNIRGAPQRQQATRSSKTDHLLSAFEEARCGAEKVVTVQAIIG